MTRREILAPAYRRIHELVLERRSRPYILDELGKNGPRHWRGGWTDRIVRDFIWRLRKGMAPKGSLPVPAVVDHTYLGRTPPEVIELIETGRQSEKSFAAIADDLNARGLRPARTAKFTRMQCIGLYYHRRYRRK